MFKVPTLNKNKKEEDNIKNGKDFQCPWTDLSDLKVNDKLGLKLLISLGVSQEYGVLKVIKIARYFNPAS